MRNKNNCLILIIALALSYLFISISGLSYVYAQEKKTLIDLLFSPKQTQPRIYPKKGSQKLRNDPNAKLLPSPKSTPVARSMPIIIEKSKNAKKILVMGDLIAASLSDGLSEIYADNSNYKIIKRTNNPSGLIRNSYYNWQKNISEFVAQENPDLIIFVIGANDHQAIKVPKSSIEFDSPEWNRIYQERISALVKNLEITKKPWLWVGLPSVGKPQLNKIFAEFNAYYNAAVSNTTGQFIDIWNGFVDDKGNFALSGYDMNGQNARLRSNDGVTFTPAGRQKLAFYVKAHLEAILNGKSLPRADTLSSDKNIVATNDVERLDVFMPVKKVTYIAPMNLTELPQNGSRLLGSQKLNNPLAQPNTLIINENQQGRADYFLIP